MKHIKDFINMKKNKESITMLTAYDYISAVIAQNCDIDIILVGDSLGMVMQGENSTLGVSLQDIIYHSKIVRKGADNTFIIADMPYSTYHIDLSITKRNAFDIIIQTKANAVKIEGGNQNRLNVISSLVEDEIPVCAHLGMTPQSINRFGSFKVQAKETQEQDELLKQALNVEKAGAFMLVLECVPELIAKQISEELSIPVIGIGAGRYTDGQVMVWHDILGLSNITPKFVKKYIDLNTVIQENVNQYREEVKNKKFPMKQNVYFPIDKDKGV
ncbi:MAG: 3-methyl-2-oxobutanoate hydroxymethyltransferase [Candidatus Cloacimonetes bacterium]|nr:3-methyl-2-oxobutanoate hydroxymethyltransferase [Candidatus Cloacimonadota bacterium]MDD4155676.1 3-methyl-2-oxobutanoate hydroxymethyltransferase [Candidatus Cloacimonadota bacterium]